MENCTYKEAIRVVAKELGISNSSDRVGFKNRQEEYIEDYYTGILNYKNFIKEKEQKVYSENILKCFDANTFYKGWIDEGISIETMQKFEIEFDDYQKRIIIPNRNINGDLIGVRRRYLDNNHKDKYKPIWFGDTLYRFETG